MPRKKLPENEKKIIDALRGGPLSFTELLEITGLPRATLTRYLKDMKERGIIDKIEGKWVLRGNALEVEKQRLLKELKEFLKLDKEAIEELDKVLTTKDVENLFRGIDAIKKNIINVKKALQNAPPILRYAIDLALKFHSAKLDVLMFLQLVAEYRFYKSFNLLNDALKKTLRGKLGQRLEEPIAPLKEKGEYEKYSDFLKEFFKKHEKESPLGKLHKDKEYCKTMEKIVEWSEKYVPKRVISKIAEDAIRKGLAFVGRGFSTATGDLLEVIFKLGSALELSGSRSLTEKEIDSLKRAIDSLFKEIIKEE